MARLASVMLVVSLVAAALGSATGEMPRAVEYSDPQTAEGTVGAAAVIKCQNLRNCINKGAFCNVPGQGCLFCNDGATGPKNQCKCGTSDYAIAHSLPGHSPKNVRCDSRK